MENAYFARSIAVISWVRIPPAALSPESGIDAVFGDFY